MDISTPGLEPGRFQMQALQPGGAHKAVTAFKPGMRVCGHFRKRENNYSEVAVNKSDNLVRVCLTEQYEPLISINLVSNEWRSNVRVNNKPILLVEDDQVDMMTVTRALKQIHVTNKVVHLENGEEALNYLRDGNSDKPCIILLDLNMPVMNGIEFLQTIKDDEKLMRIPVVVLTTSDEQQDKLNSFNFGVAGYMSKPVDYLQFVKIIGAIDSYWTISEMP